MSAIYSIGTIFNRWPLIQGIKVVLSRLIGKPKMLVANRLLAEDKKYTQLEQFHYKLLSKGNAVLVEKSGWNIKGIFLRRFTSDYDVFEQIYLKHEFKGLISLIGDSDIKLIIDAGANIGISSILLHSFYPAAKIIAIEPDSQNFECLKKNLEFNLIQGITIKSAVWHKTTKLYFDRNFGDGREWAVSVTDVPNENGYIASTSFNDLVQQHNINSIDILKIDVEGSEKEIFQFNDNRVAFLDITRYIAIELHQETNASERIIALLKEKGFQLSKSGEYIIGYNKNLKN